MLLKFPAGKAAVSIRDLQKYRRSQPACIICDKGWHWSPHCISTYLCVLHPCQHLVGSGCWKTVPEEHKDKCPLCKVKIGYNERVLVLRAGDMVDLRFYKKMWEEIDFGWEREMSVKEKMEEGLNAADVATMLYFVNLCGSLDVGKERVGIFLASGTEALNKLDLDRLISFLTHMPQCKEDNTERQMAVALHAFNKWRGTNFSVADLGMAVSSPNNLTEILEVAGFLKRHVKKVPRRQA